MILTPSIEESEIAVAAQLQRACVFWKSLTRGLNDKVIEVGARNQVREVR